MHELLIKVVSGKKSNRIKTLYGGTQRRHRGTQRGRLKKVAGYKLRVMVGTWNLSAGGRFGSWVLFLL
jgi:hypothetical protein